MIAVIVFAHHEPEPGTRANRQWNEPRTPYDDGSVYVAMMLSLCYAKLGSRRHTTRCKCPRGIPELQTL